MIMSSNELNSNNSTSSADKVTSNNPTSLFNGVNGEDSYISNGLPTPSSASILGSGSEASSVIMPGGNSAHAMDPSLFMPQPTLPYTHFASMEGSWNPTPYDPTLMTPFGFTGAGMMSGQAAAGGFYFPGTAADLMAGIWGQENSVAAAAAASSLMLNSFPVNPLPIDQQQMSGSEVLALDPMMGLGQGFAAMAVNGSPLTNLMQMGTGEGGGSVIGIGGGQSAAAVISSHLGMSEGIDSMAQTPHTATIIPAQVQNNAPQPEKPKSWAAIASQPAKPRPPPTPKAQPLPESNAESLFVSKKSGGGSGGRGINGSGQGSRRSDGQGSSGGGTHGKGSSPGFRGRTQQSQTSGDGGSSSSGSKTSKPVNQSELVGKLKSENKYNPSELTINTLNARFFVIKSYAEDDIHRSIKYNIWTSTDHGNRRLDQAFRDQKGKGGIYLFFSVNGSGHFCGVAQMVSEVDFDTITGVWAQDKWKGRFEVKWIYVKDVPNSQLRHIRLENNENKPVTNSRDTQEVPLAKARQVIKMVHSYQHTTSIFDDFDHYEKKQEEETKST